MIIKIIIACLIFIVGVYYGIYIGAVKATEKWLEACTQERIMIRMSERNDECESAAIRALIRLENRMRK